MDNISSVQQLMLKACLATSKDIRENAVRRWEEQVVINDLDFSSSRLIPYFFYRNQQDGIVTKHDKRIKVIYKHWWLRTQHINHQLKGVHAALSEAGIDVVIIKGASIKMHYECEELRPMADFDLLVPKTNLQAALQIVTNLNYRPVRFPKIAWEKYRSLFLDFAHAVSLSHQKNNTEMDLHWKVGSQCSTQFTHHLWLHLEDYEMIENAKKPQLAYEVFMLIIHAVNSGSKDNLNWIIDIAVINAKTDHSFWEEARKIAVVEKKEHLFDYGCSILIKLGVLARNPDTIRQPNILVTTEQGRRKQMSLFMLFYYRLRNLFLSVNRLFPHSNVFTKLYYIARRIYLFLILRRRKS